MKFLHGIDTWALAVLVAPVVLEPAPKPSTGLGIYRIYPRSVDVVIIVHQDDWQLLYGRRRRATRDQEMTIGNTESYFLRLSEISVDTLDPCVCRLIIRLRAIAVLL